MVKREARSTTSITISKNCQEVLTKSPLLRETDPKIINMYRLLLPRNPNQIYALVFIYLRDLLDISLIEFIRNVEIIMGNKN